MAWDFGALAAGLTAADPLLKGLAFEAYFGSSSEALASIQTGLDTASGAITNNINASLSPAASVLTSGSGGSYNDTSKNWTVSSTAGLTSGDYWIIQHASINSGNAKAVKILAVVDATTLTLVGNPANGLGNLTNIVFRPAYKYNFVVGTGQSTSSVAGSANIFKSIGTDASGNANVVKEDTLYGRDAPAGTAYVSLAGQVPAGASGNNTTPTLDVLPGWANRGGIATMALTGDFKWNDGTQTEKTPAAALASPLTLTAGNGTKVGSLILRSMAGSSLNVTVAMSYALDTTAPVMAAGFAGR